jgi:tetratricopeptide (TPR) repeat protein
VATQISLDSARSAFEIGRFDTALATLRQLPLQAAAPAERIEAQRLHCLSAYRLGELDEAADEARAVVGMGAGAGQGDAAPDHPGRFDVLTVGVVAAGELARYDESLEHLRALLALASRAGHLTAHVRGRGSAAVCFTLLGDPWAGRRVLAELIGLFQGLPDQTRLEATARNNHASVCLQIARMAVQGADTEASADAAEHARASMERLREIAALLSDARLVAFADVHEGELALLCGHTAQALPLLTDALARAEEAGLWAHTRQLHLLVAEALVQGADASAALTHLAAVGAKLGPGHELGARIRHHALLHRAHAALGHDAKALHHLERARELADYRHYRQQHAQSRFLRARLEMEHLYPYRGADRA